ncbi:MAG: hypothetical protein U0800_16895 [Isosphaeraceae bacterium]
MDRTAATVRSGPIRAIVSEENVASRSVRSNCSLSLGNAGGPSTGASALGSSGELPSVVAVKAANLWTIRAEASWIWPVAS